MKTSLKKLVSSGNYLKFKEIFKLKTDDEALPIFNKLRSKLDLDKFELLTDSENIEDPDYGCFMLYINIPKWDDLLSYIEYEDIFDNNNFDYGLDYEPHVTILYGFHQEKFDIKKLNDLINYKKYCIKIVGIDFFENDEYDVLIFKVESDDLYQLNKICIKNFEYTNEYKDYKPHMTICYLKKGLAKKYIDIFNLEKPIKLCSNKLVYSYKSNKKYLSEREIKYMDGVSSVEVKDECKLGGLPDGTSKQCNQGDINALNIKKL